MKKLSIIPFLFIALCIACSGGAEKKNTSEEQIEEAILDVLEEATEESGGSADCDKFLDDYEEWANAYMDVLEKYMKNPMDANVSQEYMESLTKAAEWAENWTGMYVCASNEKYSKRFDEIVEKMEKRMEEIGFE